MKGQQRAYKKWGTVSFRYVFLFPDDREEVFALNLDAHTLDLLEDIPEELSSSTRLDFHQCQNCQLTIQKHPNCFVSVRLVKIWCERGELNPYGVTHWILSLKTAFLSKLYKPLILRIYSLLSRAFLFSQCW
jgi:hypothetical protein